MTLQLRKTDTNQEVAVIKDGNSVVQTIYMTSLFEGNDDSVSKKDKRIKIKDNKIDLEPSSQLKFHLSPETYEDNNIRLVVVGQSGSGKSYWVGSFVNDFVKRHTRYDVLLFSRHEKDPSLDDRVKKLKRVVVTDSDIVDSLQTGTPVFKLENLRNSFLIFDDTFDSQSRYLNAFYSKFTSDLAMNARKYNISMAFVIHNTNYKDTRIILSEASAIVLFLNSSRAMNKRILKVYCGMTDKNSDILLSLKNTRYLVIKNLAPRFFMTETSIFTEDTVPKLG